MYFVDLRTTELHYCRHHWVQSGEVRAYMYEYRSRINMILNSHITRACDNESQKVEANIGKQLQKQVWLDAEAFDSVYGVCNAVNRLNPYIGFDIKYTVSGGGVTVVIVLLAHG